MFFCVIEKGGELKAVHSQSDLTYMQARGWQVQAAQHAGDAASLSSLVKSLAAAPPPIKRKPGRPRKVAP